MDIDTDGGRIVSFKLNGHESLVQEGIQVGSTFWPAPQSLWGWPPPKVLDADEYQIIEHSVDKIVLLSQLDPGLNVQVEKTLIKFGESIQVQYKLINRSDKAINMAAWEISRLEGGVTFYDSTDELEPQSTLAIEQVGATQWYDYQPQNFDVTYNVLETPKPYLKVVLWNEYRLDDQILSEHLKALSKQHPKEQSVLGFKQIKQNQRFDFKPNLFIHDPDVFKIFGFGSSGWLANANNGLLMIKSFDKVVKADVSVGESEIEIYAHHDADQAYIEIEQQSKFVEIAANDSFVWPVNWSLLELKSSQKAQSGNEALVELVKSHLKL